MQALGLIVGGGVGGALDAHLVAGGVDVGGQGASDGGAGHVADGAVEDVDGAANDLALVVDGFDPDPQVNSDAVFVAIVLIDAHQPAGEYHIAGDPADLGAGIIQDIRAKGDRVGHILPPGFRRNGHRRMEQSDPTQRRDNFNGGFFEVVYRGVFKSYL